MQVKKSDLEIIANTLQNEGVVILPTETIFGIAALYPSIKAYKKIYVIKKRPQDFFIPLLVSDLTMLKSIANINEKTEKFIQHFSPGPITYIVDKHSSFSNQINHGTPTIAIRIPEDEFLLNLIRKINAPLLVTSCNYHGEPNYNNIDDIIAEFSNQVDLIVNGSCKYLIPSTIIDLKNYKILRAGAVEEQKIQDYLKREENI